MAVAQMHVASWQTGYEVCCRRSTSSPLRPEDRAARYTFTGRGTDLRITVIALAADKVVGFATSGPARDVDDDGLGELGYRRSVP